MMSPEKSSARKQRIASATCDLCKTRHQKCSKDKPTCHYCRMRGVDCVYLDIPSQKNAVSTTHREQILSKTKPSAKVLKTSEGEGAGDALSTFALENTFASRNLQASDSPYSSNEASSDGNTGGISSSSPSMVSLELQSCKASSTDFLLEVLSSYCEDKSYGGKGHTPKVNEFSESDSASLPFLATSAHESVTLEEQLPDKATTKSWLASFLRGPNLLFRICDEAETWKLVDSIYAEEYISHASKCSVWLQLAIGCRLTTFTAKESHITLFGSGYQHLQWCIEQEDEVSPLWIVHPLMLVCLYTMGSKPRSCWLTLGAAIRLAQAHNLDREWQADASLSKEEYERRREIWRAMISLDAWLSITLGEPPQITRTTTQDSFVKMTPQELAFPDNSIEVNIAKLSVLISRFQASVSRDQRNASAKEYFFQTLEVWASELPQKLRYCAGPDDSDSLQAIEAGSLYLEIFYFASIMALSKAEFFASLSAEMGHLLPNRLYSQTCIDASAQIAYIASTMLDRGFLVKGDWCVVTLVYHAGVVLALSLKVPRISVRYKLQPVKRPCSQHQSLEASINVLSVCAPHNPLARQFGAVLRYYQKILSGGEEDEVTPAMGIDGCDLFMDFLSPTLPSATSSTTTKTIKDSSSYSTSSNTPSSALFYPHFSSGEQTADPSFDGILYKELPHSAAAPYAQLPVSDLEWGEGPTTVLSHVTNYSLEIEPSPQSNNINPYFGYYSHGVTFTHS